MERDVLCSMIPSATLRSRHPILAHNVLKEDDWRKHKYLFLLLTEPAQGGMSQLHSFKRKPQDCSANSNTNKPNGIEKYIYILKLKYLK